MLWDMTFSHTFMYNVYVILYMYMYNVLSYTCNYIWRKRKVLSGNSVFDKEGLLPIDIMSTTYSDTD